MSMSRSRRVVPRLIAIGALLLIYALARLPGPPDALPELAKPFRFESQALPVLAESDRIVRPVRPSLRKIDAWISSVGAGVALHDLDGDGLSNDVLYVETRTDHVVVAPVPGTGERYAAFDLMRAPGCAALSTAAPMGVVPHDADEDGRADAMVYFWGRSPLLFLRRGGALSASAFECRELVQPREEWFTSALTFADVDGDGHADVLAGNYFREDSGVLDPRATSDEMQMQDSMSFAFNGGVNRLLLWTPAGYREAQNAFAEDVARGWTLAIGAQDLDGDLLPELYFANDFGPDRLLRNRSSRGRPRFEIVEGRRGFFDPKSKVLGHDSFKGMGVDFHDVNGDALPDFMVSNITDDWGLEESSFLHVSSGKFAYRDASETLGVSRGGWNWDVRFGDFDNDGSTEILQAAGFIRGHRNRWPELHETAMANDTLLKDERIWCRVDAGSDLSGDNRNPFFTRARDGRWYDVARELGIPEGTVSRGIATGDVDGDGRLDFAVANQWQASQFFRNAAPGAGHALVLHLRHGGETRMVRGTPKGLRGSPAIGASARVRAGDRVQIAQVDGGNGHSGKRAPELHFGLGEASAANVEVSWRDRRGAIHRRDFRVSSGTWTIELGSEETR